VKPVSGSDARAAAQAVAWPIRGKAKTRPKGRALDHEALSEVGTLTGGEPPRRDLLIEYLHLIQDRHGHLSAAHLRALAERLRIGQAEVFEVASFYHHFDIVKEDEAAPPPRPACRRANRRPGW
jgi:formate dehydrogenase beta subunit